MFIPLRFLIQIFSEDVTRENLDLETTGSTKCFCGSRIDNNLFQFHVITEHTSLLPTRLQTNKCFDNGKCCYCGLQSENGFIRRYHLYSQHKDELEGKNKPPESKKKDKDETRKIKENDKSITSNKKIKSTKDGNEGR